MDQEQIVIAKTGTIEYAGSRRFCIYAGSNGKVYGIEGLDLYDLETKGRMLLGLNSARVVSIENIEWLKKEMRIHSQIEEVDRINQALMQAGEMFVKIKTGDGTSVGLPHHKALLMKAGADRE